MHTYSFSIQCKKKQFDVKKSKTPRNIDMPHGAKFQ